MRVLSPEFQHLYCSEGLYESFSVLHPVSFARVLPFQEDDAVADKPHLLAAEVALLQNPNDQTRLAVVEALGQSGLLSFADVTNLIPVVDLFDADFFELMAETYANAGMFICALRWYREFIAELEANQPATVSDRESVYASVGYCLYSLGLYPEAITWSKSCIGPIQNVHSICRALLDHEALSQGGCVQAVDRAASRARYTVSASDAAQAARTVTPRIKYAMERFAALQDTYVAWINSDAPVAAVPEDGYPFQPEDDASPLLRHRMNLIFSLSGHAEELAARGYLAEAKRSLLEAALLEPNAGFIQEQLKSISLYEKT